MESNRSKPASLNIAVFGLGEAGRLISADLAQTGAKVRGYDPRPVNTPMGVERCLTPQDAVHHADLVLALTAAADAEQALNQAFTDIPIYALYSDFSTASAGLKQRLAAQCAIRSVGFTDVALMAVVPGKGLKTPALAAGTGAESFATQFAALGMPIQAISTQAGDAATRKLLRSVMMKGLAAVVIEAMEAGHQAGCADWLWQNMAQEISQADELLLARLVQGTKPHALRRLHEMEASSALLAELGIEPIMTNATVQSLQKVLAQGIPELPIEVKT